MIFYKTTAKNNATNAIVRTIFDTSKDAAASTRAKLRKEHAEVTVETVPFEFANTKPGLQAAFNKLFA